MYALTEDQVAIQDLVRRIARERVAQRADAIDRDAEYPQDMFDLLKDLGLFALPLPTEHGGTGSLLAGCLAIEELGRVCYNTGYLLVVQWVAFGALHAAGGVSGRAGSVLAAPAWKVAATSAESPVAGRVDAATVTAPVKALPVVGARITAPEPTLVSPPAPET